MCHNMFVVAYQFTSPAQPSPAYQMGTERLGVASEPRWRHLGTYRHDGFRVILGLLRFSYHQPETGYSRGPCNTAVHSTTLSVVRGWRIAQHGIGRLRAGERHEMETEQSFSPTCSDVKLTRGTQYSLGHDQKDAACLLSLPRFETALLCQNGTLPIELAAHWPWLVST